MAIYWSFLKKKCGAFGATAILPFFVLPIVLNQFTNGLESGLLILVLGILLWSVDRWQLLLPQNGIGTKSGSRIAPRGCFSCAAWTRRSS